MNRLALCLVTLLFPALVMAETTYSKQVYESTTKRVKISGPSRSTTLMTSVRYGRPIGKLRISRVSVTVDQSPLKLSAPPMQLRGHILVPMRSIFEGLGAAVQYNRANRQITATKGSTSIALIPNLQTAVVNGETVSLPVPPMMLKGQLYVPLRFVSQALGANVHFNAITRVVSINTMAPALAEQPTTLPPARETTREERTVIREETEFRRTTTVPVTPPPSVPVTVRLMPDNGSFATINPAILYLRLSGLNLGTINEKSVRIYLDTLDLTNQATLNGEQITVNLATPFVEGEHTVHIVGQKSNGENFDRDFSFKVNREMLASAIGVTLSHNITRPLNTGDVISVVLTGPPGGQATFDIGTRTGLAMTETSPGFYTGTYTVQAGDDFSNALVVGHLMTASGQHLMVQAATGISVQKNVQPSPARPAPSPQPSTPTPSPGY